MSDQLIVERSGLEKKEKGELQAIISALGGTSSSRSRKSELIDQILVLSGAAEGSPEDTGGHEQPTPAAAAPEPAHDRPTGTPTGTLPEGPDGVSSDQSEGPAPDTVSPTGPETAPDTVAEAVPAEHRAEAGNGSRTRDDQGAPDGVDDRLTTHETRESSQDRAGQDRAGQNNRSGRDRAGQNNRGGQGGQSGQGQRRDGGETGARGARAQGEGRTTAPDHPVGPDGEPLADWELALADGANQAQAGSKGGTDRGDGDDADAGNRRNRRRGRGRGREREDVPFEPAAVEPIPVSGVLDLRDEGYGFLRVESCLPSKDDVYVSVKQVRQYGLRKGDVLTGLSRPAARNEKNPGFHQIDTVNGLPADEGRRRPRFDDLTPLFPDERLTLEMRDEPLNMATRIIDLVAPIGKGQRALIVSPPKAGKTTIMKDLARAIETNNPEVRLIVLLLDERPEEVTDMSRHLVNGEVVASTFDRPPEEHCAVAELTIERAKRLVEAGEDVCIIVDGITRLARAYNLTAPQTGRAMSGGVDAGALYPPKRFFGAARNLEEGGSLTILATALVETGSRMDEVIFEEFKGTGNCEIRLDRRLAERRLFPAIDIDTSSTRHEELLFDRQQLQAAWKLRRVLSAMKADDGSSAGAIEMLVDRLKTFRTNADFLNEIAKSPSL